ncbi:MAG: response regulator [Myxococcales bacterium]|nr:response regulator [Myxococcales bacterium]
MTTEAERAKRHRRRLGEILLERRLLDAASLERHLAEQRAHPGLRLASALAATSGVPLDALLDALSAQHGVPAVDPAALIIPLEEVGVVPRAIAERERILPILVQPERLFLAMADPQESSVVEQVAFATGRRVYPYVALQEPLEEAIAAVYDRYEAGKAVYVGADVPPEDLTRLGLDPREPDSEPPDAAAVERSRADSFPVPLELDRAFEYTAPPQPPPLPRDVRSSRSPERSAAQRPRGRYVLVVDDEADIRRLLVKLLGRHGCEVEEAADGHAALTAIRRRAPDLVLLDAMLPGIHGFDVCRRLSGSKRYGGIPVIMISAIYRGWRVAEDLRERYGVREFIEKPFKLDVVVDAVERALSGRAPESLPVEDPSAPSSPPRPSGRADGDLSGEAAAAFDRAMVAFRRGDLDGAIADLQAAVAVDPLSFRLSYHLGLVLARRKRIFAAIDALEAATHLQPDHYSAPKNLALLYQGAGFRRKALEMWERAYANARDDDTRRMVKGKIEALL